jgi:hypothetical protein
MENATSDHTPFHGWLAAPKEKIRRAPSSRIAAARELSREHVRRPVLDVTSNPLRVSRLSAAAPGDVHGSCGAGSASSAGMVLLTRADSTTRSA